MLFVMCFFFFFWGFSVCFVRSRKDKEDRRKAMSKKRAMIQKQAKDLSGLFIVSSIILLFVLVVGLGFYFVNYSMFFLFD
jgi:hypothetical protein